MGLRGQRGIRPILALAAASAIVHPAFAIAAADYRPDRTVLPIQPPPFNGVIGDDAARSTPSFPAEVKAPAGAPNVIVVMTDDVGFAASSAFGGVIPTPALDTIATNGLRYNNFHTTAMCSPSRAALLTGRNHHAVSMGSLTDLTTGYPGYWARLPKSAATIAEVLRQNGFNTAFFGKHHNVPKPQNSVAGPFDNWPTGLGFEYFYGFVGPETDQWHPALVRGTSRLQPPGDKTLDRLMADDAISWIHNQKAAAPDKPFFIYYAPGSAHAPHQAPADWIARFKGKFDAGWDVTREQIFRQQKAQGVIPANAVLTPRPPHVPAWDSLSADEKRIEARLMEIYAAQLAYQDDQFGRIFAELKRMGQFDNTLIMFIEGDNGASFEGGEVGNGNTMAKLTSNPEESTEWLLSQLDKFGGPESHNNYPRGWAWAMNTPFQLFKRFASHLGGIRNGMVIPWPERIKSGGNFRPQFTHLIDVMPTVLEATGVPAPRMVNGVAQQPMNGVSIVSTFASPKSESPRKVQYFELLGNRSIYNDGWLASSIPPDWFDSTSSVQKPGEPPKTPPLEYKWALYDLRKDFSQSRDLSEQHPEKLKAMETLWWQEARKNNVLPIDNSLTAARLNADSNAHGGDRPSYIYWGGDISVATGSEPPINRRSFVLTGDVQVDADGGSGVIAAYGNRFGGWSFYLKNGIPMVHQAFTEQPQHQFVVRGDSRLLAGKHIVSYEVSYRPGYRGADVVIRLDGRQVASGQMAQTVRMVDTTENFDIGHDSDLTVTKDYADDGRFSGRIEKVTVTLSPLPMAKAP